MEREREKHLKTHRHRHTHTSAKQIWQLSDENSTTKQNVNEHKVNLRAAKERIQLDKDRLKLDRNLVMQLGKWQKIQFTKKMATKKKFSGKQATKICNFRQNLIEFFL